MSRRLFLALLVTTLCTCAPQADDTEKKANPEATRLLAEARQARALWANFPGFTADVAVTLDGTTRRGTVQVDEKGKVVVNDLPENAASWAKIVLASAVGHRLGGRDEPQAPCRFADGDAGHPLGRLVEVIGESGSNYRVRDQQIMMVNRTMGETRFSITMLENQRNEEGRYLPRSYSVHYWDVRTGALKKTESHHQTWARQKGLDLPVLVRVIAVEKSVDARAVALSNLKLR